MKKFNLIAQVILLAEIIIISPVTIIFNTGLNTKEIDANIKKY